jgi:hypothetical protein
MTEKWVEFSNGANLGIRILKKRWKETVDALFVALARVFCCF